MCHLDASCLSRWIRRFLVAAVLGPGFVAPAFAAERGRERPAAANAALGAKYTLSPQPNYSYCTDAGDIVQLTDGKSTKDYFWTQKGTVGWNGTPYAVVTVDLGRVEPIAGVAMTTAAGVAGVVWPASIYVHVSDDGTHYRDAGDLVARDLRRHGPWPKGYAIRRLVTDELATRGRFVRFMIIPLSGGGFIFTDEVEVLRGPAALVQGEPRGKPVGEVAEIFQRGRISRALRHRFTADTQALEKAIKESKSLVVPPSGGSAVEKPPKGGTTNGAKPIGEAVRNRLLGQLAKAKDMLKPEELPHDASFRAVLPMGDGHAGLFRLQAELWRAGGTPPLTATAAVPWDPLDPFQRPDSTSGAVEVHAMRGEYRSGAVNLANSTDRPMDVRVQFEGLPGSPNPGYVTVHEVQWTDTSQGVPVAAALPEARRAGEGWSVRVLPGLVRQVWLTFHAVGVEPGQHAGKLVFRAEGLDPLAVPVQFRVWPPEMPSQATLWLGGWDYTDGDSTYGVTPENREPFLRHLREHFVNTPWASGGVMLQFTMPSGDPAAVRLDTRQFDAWIARWPKASRYMVFLSVGANFAGSEMGKPEFDRRVGTWITAWVRHLTSKGISADRLGLLIHDEPNESTDARPIVAWAKALRAAQPKVLIWLDPTYQEPRKAPPELFEVCDILCPNRPMWLTGGKPFEQFYLDQKRQGRTLQFYSCSGPAKLLDPYSYHRLQAWHAWHVGGTGSYFWAFGDNSGSSSWNEYLAVAGPYTPLFLDRQTVVPGKHMEAIRESVQDYECLVMLREAVRRAKSAARADAAVAQAERLLEAGVAQLLAAPGVDQIHWHAPKNRSQADALRLKVLESFTAIR